jgi:hypothetical protein
LAPLWGMLCHLLFQNLSLHREIGQPPMLENKHTCRTGRTEANVSNMLLNGLDFIRARTRSLQAFKQRQGAQLSNSRALSYHALPQHAPATFLFCLNFSHLSSWLRKSEKPTLNWNWTTRGCLRLASNSESLRSYFTIRYMWQYQYSDCLRLNAWEMFTSIYKPTKMQNPKSS